MDLRFFSFLLLLKVCNWLSISKRKRFFSLEGCLPNNHIKRDKKLLYSFAPVKTGKSSSSHVPQKSNKKPYQKIPKTKPNPFVCLLCLWNFFPHEKKFTRILCKMVYMVISKKLKRAFWIHRDIQLILGLLGPFFFFLNFSSFFWSLQLNAQNWLAFYFYPHL